MDKFQHAFRGLTQLFITDKNIRLQFGLGGLAIVASIVLRISATEWLVVLFAIGLVCSMEIMNTCIEKVCDFIHPDDHLEIKYIKDGAAAAVLVSSTIALVVAIIIFSPKIYYYAQLL